MLTLLKKYFRKYFLQIAMVDYQGDPFLKFPRSCTFCNIFGQEQFYQNKLTHQFHNCSAFWTWRFMIETCHFLISYLVYFSIRMFLNRGTRYRKNKYSAISENSFANFNGRLSRRCIYKKNPQNCTFCNIFGNRCFR